MNQLKRRVLSFGSVLCALALVTACGKNNVPQSTTLTSANVTYDYSRLERPFAPGSNDDTPKVEKADVKVELKATELDAVYQASKALTKQAEAVAAGTAKPETITPLREALAKATNPVLESVLKQIDGKVDVKDATSLSLGYGPDGLMLAFTKKVDGKSKLVAGVVVEYTVKDDKVTDSKSSVVVPKKS